MYLYNCKGFRKQGKKKLKRNDEICTRKKRNEKKKLKDTYLICKQEKKLMSNVMKEKKIERYLSHCKQGKKK